METAIERMRVQRVDVAHCAAHVQRGEQRRITDAATQGAGTMSSSKAMFTITGITVDGSYWSKQVWGDAEGSEAMGALYERIERSRKGDDTLHKPLLIGSVHDSGHGQTTVWRVGPAGALHEVASYADERYACNRR